MTRTRLLGSSDALPLTGEWAFAAAPAGRAIDPTELAALDVAWLPLSEPMPVAAALREAGQWDDRIARDLDAEDWWYRCRFLGAIDRRATRLRLEGLATVADAWLNGTHLLHSESMFTERVVDVGPLLAADNELVLRFAALAPLLQARRPRPRWRTALVQNQQLRWFRTALFGRIPAWCPPEAPVGPWRPVRLEVPGAIRVESADLRAALDGRDGVVEVNLSVVPAAGSIVGGWLAAGPVEAAVQMSDAGGGTVTVHATGRVSGAERWWPHTHGPQPLYPVRVALRLDDGAEDRVVELDLGRVGFRVLEVDAGVDGEGFGLRINGTPVFCRGACWTPLDGARLHADPARYREALCAARDAGMNMLRVGGTMVYESETFHDLCDELGILVWQDFMFANMDYPGADPAFAATVEEEAGQVLAGLQGRPSLAVLCGGSEVEQQAAMLGLPAAARANPLFDELLPALVKAHAPGVPWVPSSPCGGTPPFRVDRGVAHYYGVGAYRRPLDDARRAQVRFASECLGFANVPEPATVEALLGPGESPVHHPRWKARVPRDPGSGWDFEDVRDHYLHLVFGVDPVTLRSRDMERYLELSRVVTGEVMAQVFAEWRRPGGTSRGGLVWFHRDLWPGAGWGVVDAHGRPKAAYWYLRRAFAPIALVATDEGLNGLRLHVLNETPDDVAAELRVTVYRDGRTVVGSAALALDVPARGAGSIDAETLFEGFRDLTYAYRFGPPPHDLVAASLEDRESGRCLGRAFHFPGGVPSTRDEALGLTALAERGPEGWALVLVAERFAQSVAIDAGGFVPEDNYLHLEPGQSRRIALRGAGAPKPRGFVRALNGCAAVPIAVATA